MNVDDRELQARLIHVLNQLQATNERCRGLLLDGNLDGLVTMGRKVADLGVMLIRMAKDGGALIEPPDLTADEHVYDPRQLAAGEQKEA